LEPIKNFGFEVLYKKLYGKNARFISNCEFFPNFDVILKINKIYLRSSEIMFEGLTKSNKKLTIGSNMKNLKFELLN
jgi:hypothetical protein